MDWEPEILGKPSHERMYSWYFTREELEEFSPSRKDGITESKESELRNLYCSFIRDVGIRLKLYVISFHSMELTLFYHVLGCSF
jgi:cyclin T